MAFVVTAACIDVMDKSCLEVCPVDCIIHEEGTDRMLFINPDDCIECGACEPSCPMSAIFSDDRVPADQKEFIDLNVNYFSDKDAVRARVSAIKG